MKALLRWYKDAVLNNISPLLISAIFHYPFVTIHPFMDGNGRVGRLLTNFILHSHGYTVTKYASIEKQHEKDRGKYYSSLRKILT